MSDRGVAGPAGHPDAAVWLRQELSDLAGFRVTYISFGARPSAFTPIRPVPLGLTPSCRRRLSGG